MDLKTTDSRVDAALLAALIGASPSLWMRRYMRIISKDGEDMALERFNILQTRSLAASNAARKNAQSCYKIILKPRRSGSTTVSLGEVYARTRSNPNHRSALIADDKSDAGSTAERVARIWDHMLLNDKYQWQHAPDKRGREFSHGSGLSISSAVEKRPEQGGGLQSLVCTEMAHWPKEGPHDAMATITALMPTIREAKNGLVVLESTPNGMDGAFYDYWCGAADYDYGGGALPGTGNGFVRIFAAWHEFEENRLPLEDGALNCYEEEFAAAAKGVGAVGECGRYVQEMRALVTTLETAQIAWWWEMARSYNWDVNRCKQEYPTDPLSCFLASGRQRFSIHGMARLGKMSEARDPQKYALQKGGSVGGIVSLLKSSPQDISHYVATCAASLDVPPIAIADTQGWMRVWEHPVQGACHLVSVDVTTGFARDGDSHSVLVHRRAGMVNGLLRRRGIVARVEPSMVETDTLAVQVYLAAAYYQAVIALEMNNCGLALYNSLKHMPGVRIWMRRDLIDGRFTETPGWLTTTGNRELLISTVAEAVRDSDDAAHPNGLDVWCPQIVSQLWSFIYWRNKWQAAPKKHDDDVMSLGIGLLTQDSATPYVDFRAATMPPEVLRAMLQGGGGGDDGGTYRMRW